MSKFLAFLITPFVSLMCSAEIITTSNMIDVQAQCDMADKDTLVIFDNDDVLTMPCDAILQSANRDLLRKMEKEFLYDKEELEDKDDKAAKIKKDKADEDFINHQSIILKSRKLKLVDDGFKKIIAKLQDKNINVTLLSNSFLGRYGKIENYENLLNADFISFGINFKNSWKKLDDTEFTKLKKIKSNLFNGEAMHPAFKNGMIITVGPSKGKTLIAFLNYANIKPKKIIYIDDKMHNIIELEEVAKADNIKFVGVEYVGAKDVSTEASIEVATVQMKTLKEKKVWMSDEEVKKLINKN